MDSTGIEEQGSLFTIQTSRLGEEFYGQSTGYSDARVINVQFQDQQPFRFDDSFLNEALLAQRLNILNSALPEAPTDLNRREMTAVSEVVQASRELHAATSSGLSLEEMVRRSDLARERLSSAISCLTPSEIDRVFLSANHLLDSQGLRVKRNGTEEILLGQYSTDQRQWHIHNIIPFRPNCGS